MRFWPFLFPDMSQPAAPFSAALARAEAEAAHLQAKARVACAQLALEAAGANAALTSATAAAELKRKDAQAAHEAAALEAEALAAVFETAQRYERVSDAVRASMALVGERGHICIGSGFERRWGRHDPDNAHQVARMRAHGIHAFVPYVGESEVYRVIIKEYPHLRLRAPPGMLSRTNILVHGYYETGEYESMLAVQFWHPRIEQERLSNFASVDAETRKYIREWFGERFTEQELFG